MNILYYVEHFPYLTKIGMHHKGFYTEGEVAYLESSGEHIYRKAKVTAICKGKEVEIRRKSRFGRTRFGKYGVGVECVE
jgi:hypothetical protein